ncbi:MAG: MFS transporter [Clostridia bacterium]|nr:MFS transporter [Clostridia bacterium]
MEKNYTRVKLGCYALNVSMSVVCTMSPLLFLTFHSLYGISYSLLGLLVLINFVTQLGVDLIFSFFSHKFNIPRVVKFAPVLTSIGFAVYALVPFFFPSIAYVGLVIGTLLFSAACGLCEVLVSPIIAAMPADDPDREMSKLHSIYAWGVVGVVLVATAYLLLFGEKNWEFLPLVFVLIPFASSFFFSGAEIPEMQTPSKTSGALKFVKNPRVWLCVLAIFLGGAAENIMSQWSSSYIEQALGLEKVWGDIFGVAIFALTLGLGRTLYAKFGKNISTILLLGAIGATACYLVAALSDVAVVGLLACAFTGFCTSMLWPGNLVVASDRFPEGGVMIYALMAAGGDLGSSVGPQMVGLITDAAIKNEGLLSLAARLGLAPEQLGMKLGLLIGAIFPFVAIFVFISFVLVERKKKAGR